MDSTPVTLEPVVTGTSTEEYQFTFTEGPEGGPFTPIDFTGAAVRVEYMTRPNNGRVVRTATIGAGVTVASNTITVQSFLCNFTPNTYWYRMIVSFPNGTVYQYIDGTILITA